MTLHALLLRLRWLFRRRAGETALDEELRFHIESQTELLVRSGVPAAEAARRVRLEFGGLDQVKEECRDARGSALESVWSDVRYGLRALRNSPGFTLTALISLTLGIGANTALFTALDYAFWRPLAVDGADRLYAFRSPGPSLLGVVGSDPAMAFSYPVYRELRGHSATFEGLIAQFASRTSVLWQGRAEHMVVEFTSGNTFDLLRVTPAAGRLFTVAEDRDPGTHPVAVLSHAAWRLKFGADPGVVGRTISINRVPFVIIGVAGEHFTGVIRGDDLPQVWLPFAMYEAVGKSWYKLDTHEMAWVHLLGVVKPGVALSQALAQLNLAYRGILRAGADRMPRTWEARTQFLARQIELVPASRGVLWGQEIIDRASLLLMGLVGCVLLIACANIMGLLLARNVARDRELAVRAAVGAGWFRLVRQLLTETLLVAAGGSVCGFAVACFASPALLELFLGPDVLYVYSGTPDLRVALVAIGTCVAVTLAAGLVPALRAAPRSLEATLRSETGGTTAAHARLRSLLVAGEIALSVCLAVATCLVTRTLYNLRYSDMGFREAGLVTFALDAPLDGYTYESANGVYENVRRELGMLPGVQGVAVTDYGIMDHSGESASFEIDGERARDRTNAVWRYDVTPGYFRVLGTPVLAGREFERPGETGIIVNRTFVERYLKNRPALGTRIRKANVTNWREITGVVADERHFSYRQDPTPYAYYPYAGANEASFVIRTAGPPGAAIPAIRASVARLAPGVPVRGLSTVSEHINSEMAAERAMGILIAAFCLLATVLTAVGVYGVTSYAVARRRRELAIRMALGAGRSRILSDLFGSAARLIGLGVGLGLAASFALARLAQSYVYGIDATDPLSIAAACALVIPTGVAAILIPARRATSIDPVRSLRLE